MAAPSPSRPLDPSELFEAEGMSSADLVTGEAVLLDLRPASFATRMVAIFLDLVVLAALGIGASILIGVTATTADPALAGALSLALVVFLLVVLPTTVETLSRGRSLGKLALGIRVVRDDGGPIRFRHAVIRALVGVGEFYATAGCVALISSLANERGKRVGDLLAGTYVVRERTGGPVTPHVVMPEELRGWAAAADFGRLPDQLAMALRQFLGRVHTLSPASRDRLARALADQTSAWVAPHPPPGTHPERFLAAVVAERRDRELARLSREQQAAERREHTLHRLPFGLSD